VKRKPVCIVVITIIILIFSTYVYLSNSYQKINVFTAKSFDKETNTPILSITNKIKLIEISTIIKTTNKINGILDVAPPNYVLEIHSFTNGIKTIYLWLDKDSIKGMIIYKNNTETGYSISQDNTQRLKRIILFSKN
jgi:hypothetical protein